MATSTTGTSAGARPGYGKHVLGAGYYTATLGGALTLTMAYQNHLKLDPGGSARDVTLPAEEGNAGAWFSITNAADSTENLVIKDDGGSTIVTLNQNESATVVCDGSAWAHMGVITISLT